MQSSNHIVKNLGRPALGLLCTYLIAYVVMLQWLTSMYEPVVLTFALCLGAPLLVPLYNSSGNRLAWYVPLAWMHLLTLWLGAASADALSSRHSVSAGEVAYVFLESLVSIFIVLIAVSIYATASLIHKKSPKYVIGINVAFLSLSLLIGITFLAIALSIASQAPW